MDHWRNFEAAERRVLDDYDLAATVHVIERDGPASGARVLDMGTGPPVVLVPCGGAPAASLAPLLCRLSGMRLLALDHPGLDPNGAAGSPPRDSLRATAVAFLEGVLDWLGLPRATFVASSMGGTWSAWLAVDRPARVAALVELGCPALMLDSGIPKAADLLGHRSAAAIVGMVPPDAILGGFPAPRGAVSAELVELMKAARRVRSIRRAQIALLRAVVIADRAGVLSRLLADDLRRLAQPTLLLWGTHDPYGSTDLGRRACSLLPAGSLEIIPAGHLPWLDTPDRCAEAIQWFLRDRAAA